MRRLTLTLLAAWPLTAFTAEPGASAVLPDTVTTWAAPSATHFARAFKQHMGCSVGDYARQSRVSRARCLLVASPLSLAEIAAECGYADQAHFSREFKRFCGTTPLAFRRTAESRNRRTNQSRRDKTPPSGA